MRRRTHNAVSSLKTSSTPSLSTSSLSVGLSLHCRSATPTLSARTAPLDPCPRPADLTPATALPVFTHHPLLPVLTTTAQRYPLPQSTKYPLIVTHPTLSKTDSRQVIFTTHLLRKKAVAGPSFRRSGIPTNDELFVFQKKGSVVEPLTAGGLQQHVHHHYHHAGSLGSAGASSNNVASAALRPVYEAAAVGVTSTGSSYSPSSSYSPGPVYPPLTQPFYKKELNLKAPSKFVKISS